MANISSELAVEMQKQGNEGVLEEVLEFAELLEELAQVAQIKTEELQEMEITNREFSLKRR